MREWERGGSFMCLCASVYMCACTFVQNRGGDREREEKTAHLCSSIHEVQKENVCLAIRHSCIKMCQMQGIIILCYNILYCESETVQR